MSKDKDLGVGQILGRNGMVLEQREAKKVREDSEELLQRSLLLSSEARCSIGQVLSQCKDVGTELHRDIVRWLSQTCTHSWGPAPPEKCSC